MSGDYAQVAKGLGAHTETVDDPDDLAPAIHRAITANQEGQTALLQVKTKAEENVPK